MVRGFSERLAPQIQRPVGGCTGSYEGAVSRRREHLDCGSRETEGTKGNVPLMVCEKQVHSKSVNSHTPTVCGIKLPNHSQYSSRPVIPAVHRRVRYKCSNSETG
jgi:hypothetical protein